MNAHSFDRITRRFAERRLSRRQALAQAGAGLVAGSLATSWTRTAAQDATPAGEAAAGEQTMYLFVQSFEGGNIVPTEGQDDRYTVTLDHGLGQTVYFGDRPSRDVGAVPTPQFLDGLGFPEDNPPNAALVVETAPGETDIAVVELFNPSYDSTGTGVTYDVAVLENWQSDLELGFREEPADLATLAPEFRSAHLFIDDCSDRAIDCCTNVLCGETGCVCPDIVGTIGPVGFCWHFGDFCCTPCDGSQAAFTGQCNATFAACNGQCVALPAEGCW